MDTKEKNQEISPELNAKMKKNLLWIFIFAVTMIFAGLTSGYLVSRGGNFWVSIKMPGAFQISTASILLSSGLLLLARWAVIKGKAAILKIALGLAFGLGVTFGISQYIGWTQLIENGNVVSGEIINIRGKYGKYFTLIYEGKEISFDGYSFYIKGEPISEELAAEMKVFSEALIEGSTSENKQYQLSDYGTKFSIRFSNNLLTYTNNDLKSNGVALSDIQHDRLFHFAENIVNDKGDFIIKGKYGEAFTIYYDSEALEYKNRQFYWKDEPLSKKKVNDLNAQKNTASSYIYAFTGMHLLHWLGGIISLLVVFIKGLRFKYTSDNYLGLTLGSIYWHFLGILWLYLYAFLIFIH